MRVILLAIIVMVLTGCASKPWYKFDDGKNSITHGAAGWWRVDNLTEPKGLQNG